MSVNEAYVIEQYIKHSRSANDIAKELGTYPKKISRIITKNGYGIRGHSEAQKAAIENGLSTHPTAGKKRSEEEKNRIARGVSKKWQQLSDAKREEFSRGARERWDSMPELQKQELHQSAGRALRLAGIEGSKAEKFLQKKLIEEGYEVVLHKKGLVSGDYEIDLFLPQQKTIIEIDGRHHFEPIWGEERLNKVIEYDSKKNGQLLGAGYCVIRIKYLVNQMSRVVGEKLWAIVKEHVDNIAQKFPARNRRFIELELSLENHT